ncbi:MAG: hypothetical protein IJ588_09780 [Prevotella sp.]|nr:hypothetical protein [Prevotella sp.]
MKLNKSLFVATALFGAMLTSCSDSGYWDEASSNELGNGATYSFNSVNLSYEYAAEESLNGKDVEIVVTRGTTQGEVTLPISAVFSDEEAMSGPESITFANGSNTAAYPIHFSKELVPGQKLMARLVIDPEELGFEAEEPDTMLLKKKTEADSLKYEADSIAYQTYLNKLKNYKLTTTVTFSKVLTWSEIGKCIFVDYNFSSEGASAEDVTILHADGTNMYRIVTPFQAIYSDDPDEGFDTDTGFTFYLEDDLSISFDEEIGTIGYPDYTFQYVWGVGDFAAYASYCSVTRQNNIYDVRCLRLRNSANLYTGHFAFMWTEGWPGNQQ